VKPQPHFHIPKVLIFRWQFEQVRLAL